MVTSYGMVDFDSVMMLVADPSKSAVEGRVERAVTGIGAGGERQRIVVAHPGRRGDHVHGIGGVGPSPVRETWNT